MLPFARVNWVKWPEEEEQGGTVEPVWGGAGKTRRK